MWEVQLTNRDPPQVLLIVPPFMLVDRPSLAVSLLKACCLKRGIPCAVLYANLLLARQVGAATYRSVCLSSAAALAGEWLFSLQAFGNRNAYEAYRDELARKGRVPTTERDRSIFVQDLEQVEREIGGFLDAVMTEVKALDPRIVGITTTFQQTCAAIAVCRKLKEWNPGVVTVLGGANCESPMGEALLACSPSVDYVFSGEADWAFPDFCVSVLSGEPPARGIVQCGPVSDLDALPFPHYDDCYQQATAQGEESAQQTTLTYEMSRGCWWGCRSHCLFCGLNGRWLAHRQKSTARIVEEITWLRDKYPSRFLHATDNILPREFAREVCPQLSPQDNGARLSFEVRPTLSFQELRALRKAGCTWLQPGIESLSDRLLGLLRKGLTAANNIRLLRDCRTLLVKAAWNLLYGIPGELGEHYEEMLALFPLLEHLEPPGMVGPLGIQRFSPLYDEAGQLGLANLRPRPAYAYVFPDSEDPSQIARDFEADYDAPSEEPTLLARIREAVKAWQDSWDREPESLPRLAVLPLAEDAFLVEDTRAVAITQFKVLNGQETRTLQSFRRPRSLARFEYGADGETIRALRLLRELNYVAVAGGRVVSLVAEPALALPHWAE